MSKTSEEEKKGPAGSVRGGGGGVPGLGDKLRRLSWKILSLLPGEYRTGDPEWRRGGTYSKLGICLVVLCRVLCN